MAVEQTKIHELGDYLFDKNASEVKIPVSHPDWPRPKQISLSVLSGDFESGVTFHVEKGRLTNLVSRSVTVEFDAQFGYIPYGDVNVYRMEEEATGKWRKSDVLWGFTDANQPSVSGFSLEIDSSESLTGTIIEYIYQ